MVKLINNFTLSCLNSINQNEENNKLMHCTCDFRINLSNCVDSFILRTGSWILIFHAILISAISACFLWYRLYYQGQSLFFPASRDRGFLRSRPHDAFHLVTISSNLLQIVVTTCLLNDYMPNVVWAEILTDLPRQVSFAFSVLYLVGIIYSVPTLTPPNIGYQKKFVPNKYFVDIVALCLILGPFIINTPISYMTGLHAESCLKIANKLFEIHHIIWSVWISIYLVTLLYFWRKLFCLLKSHMTDLKELPKGNTTIQWQLETLQVAATNLSTVATVFAIW
ncbi:29677_t:CDS:2, partial [Gigaspora margarita]